MYQLNKRQTIILSRLGKVTFLYKTLQCNILITIYRDQILPNGTIRVPITKCNNNFRLWVTIPYWKQINQ